uniref:GC-rich promoter binding protein 1-like 1 n=1 Tax=Nannospalax galili TaxID=1026970 RepID=A0A8C6S153_NANGA
MAQHDFVPAWLNFSTPQSAKSSTATFEKHGENLSRGEVRFGISRRRHNSSDGFFNNGPLRTTGDSWHQSTLFHHDSVDSGVSKGTYAGITGNLSGWHGSSRGHDGVSQRSGASGNHRHWNGSFHSRKGCAFQEKPPTEIREEKKEDKVEKLQFEEEDFPSLNPEADKQNQPCTPIGTPSRPLVYISPYIVRQVSSGYLDSHRTFLPLLRFCKLSSCFCVFVLTSLFFIPIMEHKSGSLSSSRESNPVSVTKPVVLATGTVLSSPKEESCGLPYGRPKLPRRTTDRKSEFLKTLKDDHNGDLSENRDSDKLEDVRWAVQLSLLMYFLCPFASPRLLKAMGWQEYPENDESCLPLTEDELKEFHMKTEQLRRNGFGKNGFLQSRSSGLFSPWRRTCKAEFEDSDTETSSSETSDDDAWK